MKIRNCDRFHGEGHSRRVEFLSKQTRQKRIYFDQARAAL
jgi:hypothetical protein